MDCNIRCCTLVILVALVATYVSASQPLCALLTKTLGYTEPNGDILLESGQPLEINCTVYPNNGVNASSLVFTGLGKNIASEYVSIVSNDSIRLYIPKAEIQDGMYVCKAYNESTGTYSAVCLNKVIVGYKPQEVNDFTCVSHNWEHLSCSWRPPHNFIRTNYTLSFRQSKTDIGCPTDGLNPNTCFINTTTSPAYRQGQSYFKFVLTGTNALGTDKWNINISHYSVVIPDEPRNLTVDGTSIDSVSLVWYIPLGLENFPPGVIHEVKYKSPYDNDWTEADTSSLCVRSRRYQCSPDFRLIIPGLKYPNTVYNISVRCRTGKESARPFRWSEVAYITALTKPTLPSRPPLTGLGNFEIASTSVHGLRSVNLYWQDLLIFEENGDDFKYKIEVVEDGKPINLKPELSFRGFANFPNLSKRRYTFKIYSSNIVGCSVNYSEILVPAYNEMPSPPEQVTQIPYAVNGIHELSWEKPSHNFADIDSYSVFWCLSAKDLPQCRNINWTIIRSDVNMLNVSIQTDNRVLQGVSANHGELSSGIVWASCTILPGRGGAEMKPPEIEHPGSSHLYITWKLECSNRIGLITGFEIDYCMVDYCSENTTCPDATKIIDIKTDKTSYNITNLKPYSEYAIFIAVKSKTKAGSNMRSKARCVKTLEGAPDQIDSVVITNYTNSSISLTWSRPNNMNGIFRRYLIQWGGGQPKNVTDETSYILQDLESFKEYNISVSACTTTGCGVPSKAVKVITRMGRPGIPPDAYVNFINSSISEFHWSPPTATAGNLTYYTVSYEVYTASAIKFYEEYNVTSRKIYLSWKYCEPDDQTSYRLKVRAVNILDKEGGVLIGDWSAVKTNKCSLIKSSNLAVIIPLVCVLLSLVLCIFCALFSQQLWVKFNQMRDIGVKLPARLGTRQEDKSENHAIHIWNNHVVRETDNGLSGYRPSPDEQSLLKVKEEIEMVQEDNTDRDNYIIDNSSIIQSSIGGNPDSPIIEPESPPPVNPSPGYIVVSPQPSGYVTIPPLSRGYIMATLPPAPNPVIPIPQCSVISLKQNGFNPHNPKPCNSFPEPNNLYGGDMVSPINST